MLQQQDEKCMEHLPLFSEFYELLKQNHMLYLKCPDLETYYKILLLLQQQTHNYHQYRHWVPCDKLKHIFRVLILF